MAWLAILAYTSHLGLGRGGGPTEKNSKTYSVEKFWWTMDKKFKIFLDFLSKMYKKVQKNIFLHFFKILNC